MIHTFQRDDGLSNEIVRGEEILVPNLQAQTRPGRPLDGEVNLKLVTPEL